MEKSIYLYKFYKMLWKSASGIFLIHQKPPNPLVLVKISKNSLVSLEEKIHFSVLELEIDINMYPWMDHFRFLGQQSADPTGVY